MSDDEVIKLKNELLRVRAQLKSSRAEVSAYQTELIKFSQKLDQLMIQSNSEIKILNQVYKYLSPIELPKFPGFEFSRKFIYGSKQGGDYFDIFEHEDKMKFGVIISSATGYAISALFLSLILKMSHAMEAKKGMAPAKLIEHIGTELNQLATEKDQIQSLYAVIDRRNWTFTFCAVGRIQGFFMNDGQPLQLISSNSSGLGPQLNPIYSEIKLNLEAKSKIILVTEGLMDVLTQDEMAQIIQSPEIKSVHDLRNDLLIAAQIKSGLQTPLRDQTVVVLNVKDQIIKLAKS